MTSIHRSSKAKFVITLNPPKKRNIMAVQISNGSKRHGDVAYVKICTSDIGKIKIIAGDSIKYKTDGKEKSHNII